MLQVEGIGPAATLATAGVTPRVVNEHVGRHFKNHVGHIITFLWANVTGVNPDALPGNLLTGVHTYMSDLSPAGTPGKREFEVFPFAFPGGMLIVIFHLAPISEGTIDIQNGDPNKYPLVNPAYLTTPSEIVSHRYMIKNITNGLLAYDPGNIILATPFNVSDDADILENVQFAHHWTSQTRMGTSASDGAVDIRGRVFGTTNLRVCSASILRDVTDGNSCTPTVAVADIIGGLILDDLASG